MRRRTKPVQPLLVTQACESESFNDSEFTTSAAEESCDTVIYLGPKGEALSDRDLTDFEGPPEFDEPSGFNKERKFDLSSLRDFVEPSLDLNTKGSKPKLEKVSFTPEIKEKNCSCNLEKCGTSNACLHGTSMTNVDTSFFSNNSLLSSFSENRGRSLSRNTSEATIKCDSSSCSMSDHTKEPIINTSTYPYLAPGCPNSGSNSSLNDFSNRRNNRKYNSCKERTSNVSSSTEKLFSASETGRSRVRTLPMSSPANRTASLDRIYGKNESSSKCNNPCLEPRTRSEESIASSQQTVYNFERELVSKIVERLDVENEISEMEPELISRYLENEQAATAEEERKSQRLQEKFKRYSVDESIIVTVTSQERLDPMYIDSLNVSELLRKQREASIAEFQHSTSPVACDRSPEEVDEHFDLLLSKTWEPREDLSKDASSQKDQDGQQA